MSPFMIENSNDLVFYVESGKMLNRLRDRLVFDKVPSAVGKSNNKCSQFLRKISNKLRDRLFFKKCSVSCRSQQQKTFSVFFAKFPKFNDHSNNRQQIKHRI